MNEDSQCKMIKHVSITSTLQKRLLNLPEDTDCSGDLYGLICEDRVFLMAALLHGQCTNLEKSLPGGLSKSGTFIISPETKDDKFESLKKKIPNQDSSSPPLLISRHCANLVTFMLTSIGDLADCVVDCDVSSDDFTDEIAVIYAKGSYPMTIKCSPDTYVMANNISEAFGELQSKLAPTTLVTEIQQNTSKPITNDKLKKTSIESLLVESINDGYCSFSRVLNKHLLHAVYGMRLTTCDSSNAACVPVIQHNHGECLIAKRTLLLHTVTYVHRSQTMGNIYPRITESLESLLAIVRRQFVQDHQKDPAKKFKLKFHSQPKIFDAGSHLLTMMASQDDTDAHLEEKRKLMSKAFLLPQDKPLLRKISAIGELLIKPTLDDNNLLYNPHLSIKYKPIEGGQMSLVKGRYTYHHYMQDKIDDSGWGCAYRSLQTLASWFLLQGYTSAKPPSHALIQKTLVKIGDKPKAFLNSKQWIGSTEVCYVLDELLGVSSRIQFVESGAEMSSQGRVLLHHFDTLGTPVMIGGGVLAHTILGVDYNSDTGEIAYLILDPHYTGKECIATILKMGWCAWKSSNFWDKTAHYNMCMPQLTSML